MCKEVLANSHNNSCLNKRGLKLGSRLQTSIWMSSCVLRNYHEAQIFVWFALHSTSFAR